MNREETKKLYERGVDDWNTWAQELLAERERLEGNPRTTDDEWRLWGSKAAADFSLQSFEGGGKFSGFRFPGYVDFAHSQFDGRTVFDDTEFLGQSAMDEAPDEGAGASFKNGSVSFASAKFKGLVSFQKAAFAGNVSFANAEFSDIAQFRGSEFDGDADFTEARFHSAAIICGVYFAKRSRFGKSKFEELVVFENTSFGGRAKFDDAQFGTASFKKCTFRKGPDFTRASFSGPAIFQRIRVKKGETDLREAQVSSVFVLEKSRFQGAASFFLTQFEKGAMFKELVFEKKAGFMGAEFGGFVIFDRGTFRGDAGFTNVDFKGIVAFQGTVFEQDADFSSVRGRGNLALADTIFQKIPNFCQAHFDAAPAFDGLGPMTPPSWSSTANDGDDELFEPQAKWRALRRLARQGGDFHRELQFLKGEMKSRRGREVFYWIGWAYQITADFGLSVMRPAALLALSMLLFAAAYATLGERSWSEYLPTSSEAAEREGSCSPMVSALVLSVDGAFPFAGIDQGGHLFRAYDCLYADANRTQQPTKTEADRGGPPIAATLVSVVQFFTSAILLFLLVLAIRNRFRIVG